MSLDADTIVDRRRMRRKLTFWRVFAIVLAVCAVVAIGAALRVPGTGALTGQTAGSIARINITGLIRTDQQRVEALERLGKSRARAVIVHINSPGGTTSGSSGTRYPAVRRKHYSYIKSAPTLSARIRPSPARPIPSNAGNQRSSKPAASFPSFPRRGGRDHK